MRYYDVQKNWRKVKPYLDDPVVKAVLVRDFNKFTFGRWDKTFTDDKTPHQFESCDWSLSRGRPGPMPAYRWYVKHSVCHWLVLGIGATCVAEAHTAHRQEPSIRHAGVAMSCSI